VQGSSNGWCHQRDLLADRPAMAVLCGLCCGHVYLRCGSVEKCKVDTARETISGYDQPRSWIPEDAGRSFLPQEHPQGTPGRDRPSLDLLSFLILFIVTLYVMVSEYLLPGIFSGMPYVLLNLGADLAGICMLAGVAIALVRRLAVRREGSPAMLNPLPGIWHPRAHRIPGTLGSFP